MYTFTKADTATGTTQRIRAFKSYKPAPEVNKKAKKAIKNKPHPTTNTAKITRKATYNGFAIFSKRRREVLASFDSPNNYAFLSLSTIQLRLFERQALKAKPAQPLGSSIFKQLETC